MALITISGYPCSGKTKRAEQIKTLLEQHLKDPSYKGPLRKVISLSDDTLNLKRASYDGEYSRIRGAHPSFKLNYRQSIRETSPRSTVYRDAARDGLGHSPDRRLSELYQGISLPNVLCCEGNETSYLHGEWPPWYHPGPQYSICAGRFSLLPRKTCVDLGTVPATANTNMLLRRMYLCPDY